MRSIFHRPWCTTKDCCRCTNTLRLTPYRWRTVSELRTKEKHKRWVRTKECWRRDSGSAVYTMTYLRVHRLGNTRAGKRATMTRARTAFFHSSSRVWRRLPFCRCSCRFSIQMTTLSRSKRSHAFGFFPGERFRSLSVCTANGDYWRRCVRMLGSDNNVFSNQTNADDKTTMNRLQQTRRRRGERYLNRQTYTTTHRLPCTNILIPLENRFYKYPLAT